MMFSKCLERMRESKKYDKLFGEKKEQKSNVPK